MFVVVVVLWFLLLLIGWAGASTSLSANWARPFLI